MVRWSRADEPPPSTPAAKAERDAAWEAWVAEEATRVAAQRVHLPKLLNRGGVALMRAMLARAEELLTTGGEADCEAADALLEFVPEAEAEALLRRLFE